ncbi:MAG: tail fiber domain-containing protein, partial [candidate division WOR-3 bacterium]
NVGVRSTADTASIYLKSGSGAASQIRQTLNQSELRFWVNGQDRMIINSSGNVGIGVTNPGAKLDLRGGMASFNVADEADNFRTAAIVPVNAPYGPPTPENANREMRFIQYKDDGMYGAGIAFGMAPYSLSQWYAGAWSTAQFFLFYNGYGLTLQGSNQNPGGTPTLFTPTDLVTFKGSGEVGIGINPTAQLELKNKGWILLNAQDTGGSDAAGINFYETGSKSATAVQYGASIRYNEDDDRLEIVTRDNNNDKYGIIIPRSTGRVGIGRVPQNYSLEVNGDIYSGGVGRFQWGGLLIGSPYSDSISSTGNLHLKSGSAVYLSYGDGNDIYAYGKFQVEDSKNLIVNGGNLGVGTTNPGAKLAVMDLPDSMNSANVYYDTNTGIFYWYNPAPGPIKYKENIQPLEADFEKILSIQPVSFTYKGTNKKGIGYIAEDLEKMGLKDFLNYNPTTGELESIKYDMLSIYIVEILKKQQKEIEELKAEINRMSRTDRTDKTDGTVETDRTEIGDQAFSSFLQRILGWFKRLLAIGRIRFIGLIGPIGLKGLIF